MLGDELTEAVRARLERVRQLGVDVEIKAPRYVVGEIALEIEVASQVPLAFVERALRARLGAGGFFARSAFRLGTKAYDSNDRVIFDRGDGTLYFDADGSGAEEQVAVVKLTAGITMGYSDFLVI